MAPHLTARSLLVVHGTRDKVLPVRNAREIYDAARQPKQLRLLEDAGHDLNSREGYSRRAAALIPEQLGVWQL
ncbi:MAG TPA: alpha/beta hydrolase [Chthoniobacterales bacterium]|nr:alpha/beta hydrolase [Chthoniobacterales bacterium]